MTDDNKDSVEIDIEELVRGAKKITLSFKEISLTISFEDEEEETVDDKEEHF